MKTTQQRLGLGFYACAQSIVYVGVSDCDKQTASWDPGSCMGRCRGECGSLLNDYRGTIAFESTAFHCHATDMNVHPADDDTRHTAMSERIGERHASACRYENEIPEGSRSSARRTHFWPREV